MLDRLGPAACQILAVQGDVLELDSLRPAAQTVIQRFGRVDILINGAGGNRPQATTSRERTFFDLPPETLRWVFDLNLMGTILPSQVFGKLMAEQGEGIILSISSMNSFWPLTRIPAYSAAKAGVSNFTQWLAVHMAQEYSPRITVTLATGISPERCRRINLGYCDPAKIDVAKWQAHAAKGWHQEGGKITPRTLGSLDSSPIVHTVTY